MAVKAAVASIKKIVARAKIAVRVRNVQNVASARKASNVTLKGRVRKGKVSSQNAIMRQNRNRVRLGNSRRQRRIRNSNTRIVPRQLLRRKRRLELVERSPLFSKNYSVVVIQRRQPMVKTVLTGRTVTINMAGPKVIRIVVQNRKEISVQHQIKLSA
jgi:hypothetical protein